MRGFPGDSQAFSISDRGTGFVAIWRFAGTTASNTFLIASSSFGKGTLLTWINYEEGQSALRPWKLFGLRGKQAYRRMTPWSEPRNTLALSLFARSPQNADY
jgi:hypothetical protein